MSASYRFQLSTERILMQIKTKCLILTISLILAIIATPIEVNNGTENAAITSIFEKSASACARPTNTPKPIIKKVKKVKKVKVKKKVKKKSISQKRLSKFSNQDIQILERVTMSESGNQSMECMVAVAQTVINRRAYGYGSSISNIVYTKAQYSTSNNGQPTDRVKKAVRIAITKRPYPKSMLYFRQWYYHEFAKDYKKMDSLYFSTRQ